MSEKELNEAIEYNLEYIEAMNSEEIFGGDYTSSVELKYANKTIEQLQNDLDAANSRTKELSERIIKAIEILKQYNVDFNSLWLCENIDHAIYTLKGDSNE